jgi:tetratricopeptide (TPR) repeat protein
MGSITFHYPFIDSELKQKVDGVLQDAWDYQSFVSQLVELACSEKENEVLGFLALKHAVNDDYDVVERLAQVCSGNVLSRPWYFASLLTTTPIFEPHSSSAVSVDPQIIGSFTKAIGHVFSTYQEPWIRMEHYLLEAWVSQPQGPKKLRALEEAEKLLRYNLDMKRYAPFIFEIQAYDSYVAGHVETAVILQEAAIDFARKNDDQVMLARLLSMMGNLVKNSNVTQASHFLSLAEAFNDNLNLRFAKSRLHRQWGLISLIRGEYNGALNRYLESMKLVEAAGWPLFTLPQNIAFVHLEMRNGEEALEWSKLATETFTTLEFGFMPYCNMADSLVLLNRIDEAIVKLDFARDLVMKSGAELGLMRCLISEGLIDRAKGNLPAAVHNWKSALHGMKGNELRTMLHMILRLLVEAEVDSFEVTSQNEYAESSGPMMSRLDLEAREQKLPGISALVAYRRAKLRIKQNRPTEALSLLNDALKTCRSPEMDSLREILENMIQDIEVSHH